MSCIFCGSNFFLGRHHKFPQTKLNRKLYGDLLEDLRNLQEPVCGNCHAGHASPKLIYWREWEFCEALGIEPRSQTGRDRLARCGAS